MPPLLDFTDKVVLITGAATGMGRATALKFGAQGARVVVGDRDARGAETVQLIEEAGGTGLFVEADVTEEDSVAALVDAATDTYGRLDAAWNNAGVLPATKPLAEMTLDDWHRTIAVDLTGVFLSLKYEIAYMAEHGGGSIINTASVAGVIADPGMAPYVAAKHGVIGLTRAAAVDYARQGIRVNAVAPGLVNTPLTQRWLDDPEMRETVVAGSQMRRAADPSEIAGIVLYLASDLATFATGGVFTVDGGQTAH
ncbi:SDR family NAD(P)-dependent oxidoreductase [Georgenia sp. SYP-B2076]|uniref:SDR family NAD(P)-dependent oxidoreductase n=1 Tax=Georgenia sp. SYP-B2076 TaxID=2495881 RepID=UPI000F8F264D|nr:SDR family oxidoreductase [Georgenia sp. SYP-B2076]